MVAPFEADAQIAFLQQNGFADVACSEDSDLLVYGCNKVTTLPWSKFTLVNGFTYYKPPAMLMYFTLPNLKMFYNQQILAVSFTDLLSSLMTVSSTCQSFSLALKWVKVLCKACRKNNICKMQ